MGLLAGLFFFFLSLSFGKKKLYVCMLPTKHPKRCNVIGEFGCFFHSPEHKGKISLPVVLFPHLLLSRLSLSLTRRRCRSLARDEKRSPLPTEPGLDGV